MRCRILAYLILLAILGGLIYLGVRADSTAFAGSLFGAAVSILAILFVEAELRPRIEVTPEPNPVETSRGVYLRVFVSNKSLWWPINLLMDRRPAPLTTAWITFLHEDNTLVFRPGRRMRGRWADTPEPLRPLSIDTAGNVQGLWDLTVTRDAIDIAAGSHEVLDIVMRARNETQCHGWHNLMIGRPNLPADHDFTLPHGRFGALLQVKTGGRIHHSLFRIVNNVPVDDFRLEPVALRHVPPDASR